ncbi:MAG: hypothetical protein J0I57_00695, partial [Hyphomicrobium sp.]|nr:hypothetical protein [Hyphomicrobium sp.]
MTEHNPKPETGTEPGPSAVARRTEARRTRSTLDQNTAGLADRGTSPARFLIVIGIALVLLLGATNVLGVWSLPGQAEARREAARKAAERQEEARKAAEREIARQQEEARKAAERQEAQRREELRKSAEREAAARREDEKRAAEKEARRQKAAEEKAKADEEARRRERETAARQQVPPPSTTLPRDARLPDRPPPSHAVPPREPEPKPFKPNEIIEQAKRALEQATGKQLTVPTSPTSPSFPAEPVSPPVAQPAPPASGPAGKRPSTDDIVEEMRRKLDRLSGRTGETQTAARQPPPPVSTPNESGGTAVQRPDLRSTACRVDRPYQQAISACDDVIKRHPESAEAYFVRGWARNQAREHARAIPDLTRAIELDPNASAAFEGRGLADRGTSPARFLIVIGIALVLLLGATNVLGV